MHAASLRCSLPAILEDYPEESMQPGDVFVMNDCFRGGIHANDLLVFRPVWTDGRLSFFTGTLIHVADLGGSSAGCSLGTLHGVSMARHRRRCLSMARLPTVTTRRPPECGQ